MSSREDRRKARAERQAQRRAERGPRKARAPRAEPEPEPPAPVLRWFDGAGELVTDPEPPTVLQQATARSRSASEREQLYILFVGETDPETGESWCPDCNNARPFLAPFLAALPPTAAVIEAAVSRDEWKGTGAQSVGDGGSGGIGASGGLGANPTGADHPYRQLPWQADGVPCVVRCGRYGVVARLSEAELSAAVSAGADAPAPNVSAFFGLGDGTGGAAAGGDVLAGSGYLQVSGLPANPAGALAIYLKDALGLNATPDVIRKAEVAVLRPRSADDVEACRSAGGGAGSEGGGLSMLGSPLSLEWVEAGAKL